MFDFYVVPPVAISMWWFQIEALLRKCPETWENFETLESIYDRLSLGTESLFILVQGSKVVFAAIGQVVNYAKTKSVQIIWGSGNLDADLVRIFVQGLETFARRLKVEWIEYGPMRPGFERWLLPYGYEKARVITRKRIAQETLQ